MGRLKAEERQRTRNVKPESSVARITKINLGLVDVKINQSLSTYGISVSTTAQVLRLLKYDLEPRLLAEIEKVSAGDIFGLEDLLAMFGQGKYNYPKREIVEKSITAFGEKLHFLAPEIRSAILGEVRRVLFLTYDFVVEESR